MLGPTYKKCCVYWSFRPKLTCIRSICFIKS